MRLGINVLFVFSMLFMQMSCSPPNFTIDEATITKLTHMVIKDVFDRNELSKKVNKHDVTFLLNTKESGEPWIEYLEYNYLENYEVELDTMLIKQWVRNANSVTFLSDFKGTICTDNKCTWHLGIHESSKDAILYLFVSPIYVLDEDVLHLYVDLAPFCMYSLYILKKENTAWEIDSRFQVIKC